MAKPILPDPLWELVAPLIPQVPRSPRGGRPRVPDRAALTAILFVLRTGIPWEYLPREMGCGSGMTAWRRLRDWQAAGVWSRLHAVLLAELDGAGLIDWSASAADTSSVRAVFGGIPRTASGPTPPTAASPAANTPCTSTAGASPCPRSWRPPTSPTRSSWNAPSTPCRR